MCYFWPFCRGFFFFFFFVSPAGLGPLILHMPYGAASGSASEVFPRQGTDATTATGGLEQSSGELELLGKGAQASNGRRKGP